ncbi:MAG: trypsin-like peptidase domain-containing protein [Deltaproteobacteria bacterium]
MPRAGWRGAALVAFAVLAACGEPANVERDARGVIYGDDDRVELIDLPNPVVRRVGRFSVAALVRSDRLEAGTLVGPSWGAVEALCPDVRFREQPVVAACTAVLLGADVVATAAHCARLCAHSKIVFGAYFVDEDGVLAISDGDVYACSDVVAELRTDEDVDVAWLRLDRPVEGALVPARARSAPASRDESLTLLGFGGGLPMKAAPNGRVIDVGNEVLRTSHDAFAGGSGGPLVDAHGDVVAIFGGGANDFEYTPDGCRRPVVHADGGFERATSIATAASSLCRADACDPLCAQFGLQALCANASGGCSAHPGARRGGLGWILGLGLLVCAARAAGEVRGPRAAAASSRRGPGTCRASRPTR